MSRSVIVFPDDSAKPILDAVANAAKSVRVKMFIFSDPSLLRAVIAAQHRGVDVRIRPEALITRMLRSLLAVTAS